jgi:CheY-like chemotaxis protein
VDDPIVALQLLEATPYDLVLLDINMPGMTGFELCEKLRRFPHSKNTPVIFITGHNNFDNRKQSVLSGGHDFITKPVSPSELVLKATIHLLKSPARHSSTPETGTQAAQADATMNPPQPAAPNGSHPAANGESLSIAVPSVPSPHKESANVDAQNVPAAEQQAQPVASIETPQSQPGKPEGTAPSLSAAASVTETGTTNVSENIPQPCDPLPNIGVPGTQAGENSRHMNNSSRNGSNETFDKIVDIVTKIMFDDDNPTDRNKRLVRLALEHHNLHGILDGHETGGGDRVQHPVTQLDSPQGP